MCIIQVHEAVESMVNTAGYSEEKFLKEKATASCRWLRTKQTKSICMIGQLYEAANNTEDNCTHQAVLIVPFEPLHSSSGTNSSI